LSTEIDEPTVPMENRSDPMRRMNPTCSDADGEPLYPEPSEP
jgi:hypothetical protein